MEKVVFSRKLPIAYEIVLNARTLSIAIRWYQERHRWIGTITSDEKSIIEQVIRHSFQTVE
jgi:hypothetical protein